MMSSQAHRQPVCRRSPFGRVRVVCVPLPGTGDLPAKKLTFALGSALIAAALLASMQLSGADFLRYQFDFASSEGLGNGLFHNTVTGADAPGAEKSATGIFIGIEDNGSGGGQRPGLPGAVVGNRLMRINGGSWKIDLTDDQIKLGDFQLTMRVDVFRDDWDDLLSFATVANPNANYGLRIQSPPPPNPNAGKVTLTGFSPQLSTPTPIADDSDTEWHTYILTGTTNGADAVITYNVDGTEIGTVTATGGASDTMTVFYLGARHPDATNPSGRNVNAVFDDISLTTVAPPPPPPAPVPVAHYWSFNTADELPVTFAQADLYGDFDLRDGPNGFSDINETTYGTAFAAADRSLITTRASDLYLQSTGALDAGGFEWGSASFAFSYWVYDDGTDNDPGGPAEDLRGPRIFDCLSGESTGIQLGSDASGIFNLRIDDDAGGSFLSNTSTEFGSLLAPRDQWVHVTVNVDRDAGELTIFLDGLAQGTADISTILTGDIFATQDLQVGVINDGGGASSAQAQGLDDLAFYPGLLSQEQITDLAAATTTPLDILPTFAPSGPIPIVSVEYDAGELTIAFTSEAGKTYSVYGGQTLDDSAAWPEISPTDLIGNDTDLPFSHTPGVTPFFLQVRED